MLLRPQRRGSGSAGSQTRAKPYPQADAAVKARCSARLATRRRLL